jgi:hypothetical protein
MTRERIFLLVAAVGLTPIALTYGAVPGSSIPMLYDVDVSNVNAAHIFRAVMGLYLAMVVFWVLGASKETLRVPALYSVVVFMLGLAAGRAMSLFVDGMPSSVLLVIYLLLEIGFGLVGIYLIRNLDRS